MPNLYKVIDLSSESAGVKVYDNHAVARINDHEVRISIMFEDYHWHCHPDSDECFLSVQGGLLIDFDEGTVELRPGQLITVPRGVRHRTRPKGERSMNLTFELAGAQSESLPHPPCA
jgi:mannose-6-phosphate isomerase-like protein (cupin superfamily)